MKFVDPKPFLRKAFTLTANAASALGTGAIDITGGTLNVNEASGLGSGAITIVGGSLNNTSGSAITVLTDNSQNWNGDFAFTGSNNLDMGKGAVTLGGAGASRTVTVSAGTLTVGTITSLSQGLTKAGSGKLAINPLGTAVNSLIAGTLNVAAGTLQINTGADALTTMDFAATGLAGSGTIQNGGGVERVLNINTTTNNTFSGTLENGATGALGLSKGGSGTLTLAGTSSYTGTTTLAGGTLIAANTAALGNTTRINVPASSNVTFIYATDGGDNTVPIGINTGGTNLTIVSDRATPGAAVNRTMTVPGVLGLGGGTINFTSGINVTSGTPRITFTQFGMGAGSSTTTLLNPTGVNLSLGDVSKVSNNPNQTLELGGTSASNEITGIISNILPSGTNTAIVSLTKSNTSTWTLSGANTYTGTTTLSAGTLVAANPAALSGTARLNVTGTTGAGPSFVYATDGGDSAVPIGMGSASAFTIVSDRATPGAAVDRTMTVPSALAGLGTGTINFTSGPNVTSGTPRITFTQFGLGAGGAGTTTLNPTGVNLSLGDTSKFSSNANQTLELGGTSSGNEITGVISNILPAGTNTAVVSLAKSNTSTWTLTGNNTYTGATTVNGGTLVVNGNNSAATGAVTINSGGTLGGTGTVGGAITNSGTIAPGASIGTLNVNANVTDAANSHWAIELSGTSADILAVTGSVDLSAVDSLDITGTGTGSSWLIGTYTGSLNGVFDTITSGYSVTYTGGNITLNVAPVGLPGDFNNDGKVDAGDYITWRKNQNTNHALANDNGLGTPIGTAHYDLWRANFGKPPGSGSGVLGASVPEPATWLLVAMAAAMLTVAARRRANARLESEPFHCS